MAAKSIRSARQLATLLGITHTAVNKWLRDSRWKFGAAPWSMDQLPAIKRWQKATLAEDPAADDATDTTQISVKDLAPDKRAKLARTLVQTQLDKLELDVKKGLYHRVDECDRRMLRKIHAVKQELLTRAAAMPQDTPQHIRDWVQREMQRICHAFAGTST